jgi:hypothetical protein
MEHNRRHPENTTTNTLWTQWFREQRGVLASSSMAGLLALTEACIAKEHQIIPDIQTNAPVETEPHPEFSANFTDGIRHLRNLTTASEETSFVARFNNTEQPWTHDGQGNWQDNTLNSTNDRGQFDLSPILRELDPGQSIMLCHTHPIQDTSRPQMAQSETVSLMDIQAAFFIEQILVQGEVTNNIDMCVVTPSGTYILDLHPEQVSSPEAIRQTEEIIGGLEMRRLNMMFQPDAFEPYTPVTPTAEIPENNIRLNTEFAQQFSSPLFTITFRPHTL